MRKSDNWVILGTLAFIAAYVFSVAGGSLGRATFSQQQMTAAAFGICVAVLVRLLLRKSGKSSQEHLRQN